MNRRNFVKGLFALVGFSILPPAKTYERIWKATLTPGVKKIQITNEGFYIDVFENNIWIRAVYSKEHPFTPTLVLKTYESRNKI